MFAGDSFASKKVWPFDLGRTADSEGSSIVPLVCNCMPVSRMFSSSVSRRGTESFGSQSKLKRKSRAIQMLLKSSRRFGSFCSRDSSLLTLLFTLTLFLHFRQDMSVMFEKDSSLSYPMNGSGAHDEVSPGSPGKPQQSGPPSYLPLAQHLKNININFTEHKPSLQDMVYGIQRRTQRDLKPTNNTDLDSCGKCKRTLEQVLRSTFFSKKQLNLVRSLLKLITFYNISSMVTIPCSEVAHWVLPLVKATRVSDILRPHLFIARQLSATCILS